MIKRLVDIVLASTAFIILSPLLILISLVVYFNLGSPVFFKQKRIGLNGKIFMMYKFRTMRDLRPGEDKHDMARLTPLGRFLRSISLDELPELIQIIKGDMSIVGPRPLLTEYHSRYSREEFRRHEVRPGLTGWAQINGRNTLTWKNKFRYDVWYVDNQSLWLDLKIIFLTVWKIVRREGVNASNAETMEEFNPGLYVIGNGHELIKSILSLKDAGLGITGIIEIEGLLTGQKFIQEIPVVGSTADLDNIRIKKAILACEEPDLKQQLLKLPLNWVTIKDCITQNFEVITDKNNNNFNLENQRLKA